MNYNLNQSNTDYFKLCLFAVIVLLLTKIEIYGQSDFENHRKYWYFKSRLNNDFIKVGLGAGESIPAQERGANNNGYFNGDINAKMEWGDASSYLGYYIGVLATEYYLLQQNGQSTETTRHELFCALSAVNRLDYVSETYFGSTGALNGHFVRDDVPTNFVTTNYQHFNYYDKGANGSFGNNAGQGFMSKFDHGANIMESSKSSWDVWASTHNILSDHNNNPPIPEMSEDQAYSILLGLAFVKKFVPSLANDNNAVFNYSNTNNIYLASEADRISERIIRYMRYSTDLNGNHCSTLPAQGWKIKNPVTCNPVSWNYTVTGLGDDVGWASYALSEAGCVINDNIWGTIQFQALGFYPKACNSSLNSNYHNNYSKTLGVTQWDAIASSFLPGNGDNRLHVANLEAICNCVYGTIADKIVDEIVSHLESIPALNWLGIVIGWVYNIVSSIIHTLVPGNYFNNTSSAININSYATWPVKTDIDHAPLARKVLHGGYYQQNHKYSFKYLLDVMPCDNEYYLPFESPPYKNVQWSGSDRIEHSRQRAAPWGDQTPIVSGEYPALDYLFYHNLWYIHELQGGNNPNIEDFSNIYVNKNGGFAPFNTIYEAYETITTESTKFNPANNMGYMRAGKIIDFKPGTEIFSGSNLHAYIEKYQCATDQGNFRLANNNNSDTTKPIIDTQPHQVFYQKNDLINNIIKNDEHFNNLITELPPDVNDIMEVALQNAYPDYSKDLFIKPTVTSDNVKAYFTMDDDELAFINIINMAGQNLYSNNYLGKERSGLSIDLSNLPAGAYMLKFTTTKGTSKTQKVIKQ